MVRSELARRLYSASHLNGSFTLRSGQVSTEYFDKYLFESEPELLSEIAVHLSMLIPQGTEVLAGLEMGGIPIATALSLRTGLPTAFVRKKAKEYGTRKFAEGCEVRGKNLCIVEDVVTTGGQIILSCRDLMGIGAQVHNVISVIERDPNSRATLAKEGLSLYPLFSMRELELAARST